MSFIGAADQLLTPGGAMLYRLLLDKPTAGANTLRLAGDLTVGNLLSLINGRVNIRNGTTVNVLRLSAGCRLTGEFPGRYVLDSFEITRNALSRAAVDFGHGAVLDPTANNLGTVVITRTAKLRSEPE